MFLAYLTPLSTVAEAQSFFLDCAFNTGDGATVILPESIGPTLDGNPLVERSEIAVYTPDGICAGVSVWMGSSLSLTAWGDDVLTEGKDGFESGDALTFRIWDAASETEYTGGAVHVTYDAGKDYFRSDGVYESDAIYSLAELAVDGRAQTLTAPALSAPADGAVAMPRATTMSWHTVDGADAYRLEIAANADFSEGSVRFATTRTFHEVDDLQAGTTYFWRVQSRNGAGYGPWSPAFSFTTLATHEAPVTIYPQDGASDVLSSVTFEWLGIEGAETYQLQVLREIVVDSMTVVFDSTAAADTTLALDLDEGSVYHWRVRASSGGFLGQWSSLNRFQTLEENDKSSPDDPLPDTPRLLQNYPNPFNPETTIPFELPRAGHVRLIVYDLLGKELVTLHDETLQAGRHRVRWKAADVPSGTYVYVLQTSTTRLTRSLVLVK